MRAPQRPTMKSMRATQPSTPPSNVRTTGPQGTPGGKAMPARKPGAAGKSLRMGQEVYLWILIIVELAVIGCLRKFFRRFHGG